LYRNDQFDRNQRLVYAFIDPNGAGASDVALVTAVNGQSGIVFLGAEAIAAKRIEDCVPHLIEHFKRIKQIPKFESCKFVTFVEANMQWQALQISDALQKFVPNIEFPNKFGIDLNEVRLDDSKAQTGVYTTAEIKATMFNKFTEYLNMDRVSIYEDFVSVYLPDTKSKLSARDVNLKKAQTQLSNWYVRDTVSPDGLTRKRGYGGKSSGQNDDLACSFQLLTLWSEMHVMNQALQETHQPSGYFPQRKKSRKAR